MSSLSLFGSLATIYSIKDVMRAGWLRVGVPEDLCESVADHSYKAARAAFHYTRDIHLVKILLVHDLAEAIVGDVTPHDGISEEVKHARELEAMIRITKPLPFGNHIMKLYLEYADNITPTSHLSHELEKLETATQALIYEDMGYDTSEFFPYVEERLHTPDLVRIFHKLTERKHYLPSSYGYLFSLLDRSRRDRVNHF